MKRNSRKSAPVSKVREAIEKYCAEEGRPVPDLTALYGEDQEAQQSVEASEEGPLSPTVAQERVAGQMSEELAKLRMDYKDLENKRLMDLAEKDALIAQLQQELLEAERKHARELVEAERRFLDEKERYQKEASEKLDRMREEYSEKVEEMRAKHSDTLEEERSEHVRTVLDLQDRMTKSISRHARDMDKLNARLNELYRIATAYSARIDEIAHYTFWQRIAPIQKGVPALPTISMKEATDPGEDEGIYEVPEEGSGSD
jgi:DNA repair ATPase RecN